MILGAILLLFNFRLLILTIKIPKDYNMRVSEKIYQILKNYYTL